MLRQIAKPSVAKVKQNAIVKSTHLEVFDKLLSKKYDSFKMKE